MTVILNNDEITKLLPMARCLAQLDEAYRELGEGRAISRPRSDIYGPLHDNGRYVFKTMDGIVPKFEVAAVRLNSDVIQWGAGQGGIRKDKQRTAPGEKFVGLILLFSTRNGEPLAIMPDGVIQRLRVACASFGREIYGSCSCIHLRSHRIRVAGERTGGGNVARPSAVRGPHLQPDVCQSRAPRGWTQGAAWHRCP